MTGWWVSIPIVGAKGVVKMVLTDCPIAGELVGGMGKMTGTQSSLGGREPPGDPLSCQV